MCHILRCSWCFCVYIYTEFSRCHTDCLMRQRYSIWNRSVGQVCCSMFSLCNTLQQHTATHCNNTLQHIATQTGSPGEAIAVVATYCNTLQHTATRCNRIRHTAFMRISTVAAIAMLQHTTTHRNTLECTATHCNTLQHAATEYVIPRSCVYIQLKQ